MNFFSIHEGDRTIRLVTLSSTCVQLERVRAFKVEYFIQAASLNHGCEIRVTLTRGFDRETKQGLVPRGYTRGLDCVFSGPSLPRSVPRMVTPPSFFSFSVVPEKQPRTRYRKIKREREIDSFCSPHSSGQVLRPSLVISLKTSSGDGY